jgi:hypothetical protein
MQVSPEKQVLIEGAETAVGDDVQSTGEVAIG